MDLYWPGIFRLFKDMKFWFNDAYFMQKDYPRLYQAHGVVNRTKPNQKPIEPSRSDYCAIDSVIEHNQTGTFRRVRVIELSNSIEPLELNRLHSYGFRREKDKTV